MPTRRGILSSRRSRNRLRLGPPAGEGDVGPAQRLLPRAADRAAPLRPRCGKVSRRCSGKVNVAAKSVGVAAGKSMLRQSKLSLRRRSRRCGKVRCRCGGEVGVAAKSVDVAVEKVELRQSEVALRWRSLRCGKVSQGCGKVRRRCGEQAGVEISRGYPPQLVSASPPGTAGAPPAVFNPSAAPSPGTFRPSSPARRSRPEDERRSGSGCRPSGG